MIEQKKDYSIKEAFIFSQKMALLSKALWKSVEKDWQQWINPFDLNINEHHILWIAYHLKSTSISEIASHGVMHVSTAFNFSKKLEKRGFLVFSKKDNDKRNTYVEITPKGEETFLQIMKAFDPNTNAVFKGSLAMHDFFGRFPDATEVVTIIRQIYGKDFIDTFEKSFKNINEGFTEIENSVVKK